MGSRANISRTREPLPRLRSLLRWKCPARHHLFRYEMGTDVNTNSHDGPNATDRDEAPSTPDEALERLVARYGLRLLGIAMAQLQDWHLAEEVVQDVLYRAYRLLAHGHTVNGAWLVRGVILASRSELRRAWWRRQVVTDPEKLVQTPTTRRNTGLLEAVQALPQPYREATVLYYSGLDLTYGRPPACFASEKAP